MKAKSVEWAVHVVVPNTKRSLWGIDPVQLLSQDVGLQKSKYVDVTHLIFAGSELYNLMPSEIKNCDLYKSIRG